jgi:selenide,water dikinase
LPGADLSPRGCGTCRPENIQRNVGAKISDAIILTKPLGAGVYSAAFEKGILSAESYAEIIATMTKLNRVGVAFARDANETLQRQTGRMGRTSLI